MPTTSTKISIVQPFTVEVDHPTNADILLQSIPGCRLRTAISGSKHIIDAKNGQPMIPVDQARFLGQLPPIPGMRLHIDPSSLSYEIIDPLHDDEDFCEKLKNSINRVMIGSRITGKLRGAPPLKGKLDQHRMKTLCREIIWLLDAKHVKMTAGPTPQMEDVDELPGNFLMNPGSMVPNSQPIFEKDYDDWFARLTSMRS